MGWQIKSAHYSVVNTVMSPGWFVSGLAIWKHSFQNSLLERGMENNLSVSSSCFLSFIGQHLPPALLGFCSSALWAAARRPDM